MVKIVSGYTELGGATIALINLCNHLNSIGIDCIFYGDQDWFRDKCRSASLSNDFNPQPDDVLICHYLRWNERPNVRKVLLACHEKWWYPVGKIKRFWDKVVFLHDNHRGFHPEYSGPYCIIPNFKEPLTKKDKPELDKIAGVIGTIEDRKQPHVSIFRALKDGCEKVYLFGKIADYNLFDNYIKPLIGDKVIHFGFTENKQQMYDMIGRVYHTSKGEIACLVKDECYSTGTKFFGNEETENEVSTLTNDEVLNLWLKEIEG